MPQNNRYAGHLGEGRASAVAAGETDRRSGVPNLKSDSPTFFCCGLMTETRSGISHSEYELDGE